MDIVGIDIGIVNLSFCRVYYDQQNNDEKSCYPRIKIKEWRIINLGKHKLNEIIPILWHELSQNSHESFVKKVDRIIIEQQVGRSNPKMLTISHSIQCIYIALGTQPSKIIFENSSAKFANALARNITLPYNPRDKTNNTASRKRTATKNNAIWLTEQGMMFNEETEWITIFKSLNKKQRENLADSYGLILGNLMKI